jgi:hypothetical protein
MNFMICSVPVFALIFDEFLQHFWLQFCTLFASLCMLVRTLFLTFSFLFITCCPLGSLCSFWLHFGRLLAPIWFPFEVPLLQFWLHGDPPPASASPVKLLPLPPPLLPAIPLTPRFPPSPPHPPSSSPPNPTIPLPPRSPLRPAIPLTPRAPPVKLFPNPRDPTDPAIPPPHHDPTDYANTPHPPTHT